MQNYSKIQKYTSFLLIFSILFSFTINISFFSFLSTIFAGDNTKYNLVSIIVEEEIYDEIKNKINRYAQDIQGVLENTKTIIIPTPRNTHPFNIASLNEKLYFEGYNGLAGQNGNSQLIGTIFVGDLALPVVENNGSYEKTIFPYVDFQEKLYFYDHNDKIYKLNTDLVLDPKAEIWHGFIGGNGVGAQEINDFFDKNHDFYIGEGNFENSNFEPYVFYYDQIRESKTINYVNYKAYKSYIENIEDITYNRFYKELNDKLQNKYFASQVNQIGDISSLDLPDELKNKLQQTTLGPDTKSVPDVHLRTIIQNTTKKFLEIFNSSTLGNFRKDVYNAGRYNLENNKVSVDLIPYLVSSLDTLNHAIIKNVNSDLEKFYDDLVGNGLSINIALRSKIIQDVGYQIEAGTDDDGDTIYNTLSCPIEYRNIIFGKQVQNMTNALDCTIYRGSTYGSGQLVESNRGFNIQNINNDIGTCRLAQTEGYWGGNSPLNLDYNSIENGEWKLNGNDVKKSITPLFDILGSIKNTNVVNNPSFLHCQDNFIKVYGEEVGNDFCDTDFNIGSVVGGDNIHWGCDSTNQILVDSLTIQQAFSQVNQAESSNLQCYHINIFLDGDLDGNNVKNYVNNDCEDYETLTVINHYFKSLTSFIKHKSPTVNELSSQINNMITQNLPIDRDRYIDFAFIDGNYQKINYPYLFRLNLGQDEEFNLENTKISLKNFLDQKSDEINNLISSKNPSSLSGAEKEIYDILKTGDYPSANIDLYNYLENKPDKEIEILGETKTINYLDSVVFSIYWNNLNSISAKYKFIIENYLSNQFGGNSFNFFLPKNKSTYEIAYLGAPGDPQNMYIKMDPEEKADNPYADIISQNATFFTSEISEIKEDNNGVNFKCAPPEGVPIWKWIPAIICWLKDMLPPKINIGDGNCGTSLLSFGNDNDFLNNNLDENKNGISNGLKQQINNGQAKYNFSSKSNDTNTGTEANLKLKDQKGNVAIQKTQEIKTSIRGDLNYIFSNKLSNYQNNLVLDSGINSVEASNSNNIFLINDEHLNPLKNNLLNLNSISPSQEKLFLTLSDKDRNGNSININFPLEVKINDEDNNPIMESFKINNLNNIKTLQVFNKSGTYYIEIKDSIGYVIKKEIEVLPGVATKIIPNISTNLIEKDGVITTNVFSIYDEFNNITAGEFYNVEIEISGDSLTFEDGTKLKNLSVFEGYKPFRLKSTGNTGNSNLTFKLKKADILIDEKTTSVNVVDEIDFEVNINNEDNIIVGNNNYDYNIQISGINKTSDFNSRAYLISNNIFIQSQNPYIDIKHNSGNGSFKTKTKAGEKIKLEFKIEGVKNSIYKEINIKPGVAIKVDLTLSKSQIEASDSATSILYIELKDRYNNIIWNDNSTSLNLEILPQYSHIITSNLISKQVIKGKTNFILNATNIPGTAFFKIGTIPNLSNNNITIDGKPPLTISGIGENTGKIETFYFWNKSKIDGKKYNSIYTTLLGGNYGDITIKNNLASSLIFDKNNKALAVTTLLNNPINHYEIINIKPNGNLKLNNKSSDLSQDISSNFEISNNQDLEVSFYNNTFSSLVSKVFLNIKNPELSICQNSDLKTCFSNENTSITLKTIDNSYSTILNEASNLKLIDNQNTLLEIDENGKFINLSPFLNFEINKNYKNSLVLDLKVNGKIIGILGINFIDGKINISRDINTIQALKNSQNNGGIVIYLEGRDYYYKETYLGNSTKEDIGYTISYNDPFGNNKKLNTFSTSFDSGYEGFNSQDGLGWKGENKTLLLFSAGQSVGESTKNYHSFSMINIGDPVVSLKQTKKQLPGTTQDRKFDSTIGHLVSKDENNLSYNIFDYNNDEIKDIVILKRGGYIELLEGTNVFGDFINRGNIVYIADYGQDTTLQTGDFTGDGYFDIVILNKNRNPILINNNQKDFVRIDLNLGLDGMISQIISYDMDLDGKHDLVVLDDNGDLHIFYGTSTSGNFTKLKVDSGLGVNISSGTIISGGALYFDGLLQLDIEKNIKDGDKMLENENNGTPEKDDFNEGLVDKLIYTQMNYLPNDEIEDSIINNEIEELNPGLNTYSSPNINKKTTFIRSEYSEYEGLKIQKKYTDLNGDSLKGGDKVKLEINITNISNSTKNNIAFLDKIPTFLKLSSNPDYKLNISGQEISQTEIIIKSSPSEDFSFLLDSYKIGENILSLNLDKNQSLKLELILETFPFKYGYIEAGIFDDTTSAGDIIFKLKNENCGKPYDLYKSIAVRKYEKSKKEPVCENNLPDNIAQNAIDEDKNGVPDYIDNLIASGSGDTQDFQDHADENLIDSGSGDTQDFQDYADEKLNELLLDSDGDGIPDREDLSPGFYNDENFMDSLDSINENTDAILEGIDTILAGLSCGFGGGGCISTPLNWAPLAPGSDPTLFGFPIGDGLKVGEGLPIFSALNWQLVGIYCVPMTWPPAILTPGCFWFGAGGRLGSMSPTNVVRIFITPTLTGAIGIATCFGGPPIVVGLSNPPGFSPFIPGGNCIVAAMPIFGCKNDGSDGEIYNMGSPGGNIINGNGNCNQNNNTGKIPYLGKTAEDYLNYKKTGNKSISLNDKIKDTFSKIAQPGGEWELPNDPLLKIGDGDENFSDENFSVEIDFGALKDGNFGDVIKIKMTAISDFPDFIMNWVKRQIEEIANKLTDFPTLYIILPDFDGIFDSGWGNFSENIKSAFEDGKNKAKIEQDNLQSQIDAEKSSINENTSSTDKYLSQLETTKLEAKKNFGSNQTISGIKSAYEFLSTLPMIEITHEKIDINLPWIDKATIDKAIIDFEITKAQWQEEINRAKAQWTDIDSYTNGSKIIVGGENLIASIDKNIEILQEYKKFPEKVHKILQIKEIRLEQILCNIETISMILGGRIGDNGKRFKTWVELYVLIKAILKSWQLLVDIFLDYKAECHECKNERHDLMYYIWKLISAIIPSIPVIQFPKWPDIYIDFHNIRVGLNIAIPEWEFNLRPILLPTLPKLYLPDTPNININLPSIPILPIIELPELPELPSLPTIELPNLPPPPKLPKLLGIIEVFLKILKIITKIMCILKSSPFIPEWRAGDQIAFITERSGFLNFDFLNISLPQFSFPFIDAIKITTRVNLEFEAEFLVEMARQIALPLNTFTNNVVNMLNIGLGDLDFRNVIPQDINIEVGEGAYIENNQKISLFDFSTLIALNILKLHSNLKKFSSEEVSNEEFRNLIKQELKNPELYKQENTTAIAGVWTNALNYSFSKEDKLIQELLKNNENKFEELKSILNEEKIKNNEILSNIDEILSTPKNKNTLILNSKKDNDYNSRLEQYNNKAISSINNLFKEDNEVKEIRKEASQIVNKINSGLNDFSDNLISFAPLTSLAVGSGSGTEVGSGSGTEVGSGSCENTTGYSYVYKGIYIIEEFLNQKISYRLFDYIDKLKGNETSKEYDFDGDLDDDVIYMVNNEIFIKENLLTSKISKNYYSGNPIILNKNSNPYYNNSIFYESINNFKESIADNNNINLEFSNPTNKNLSNFRVEFFPIIDKFSDLVNDFIDTYIPTNIKNYIIDGFVDIENNTIDIEPISNFTIRKNLSYISSVSNLSGVNLKTKELINLQDNINELSEIIINTQTKIYAGGNNVRIDYYLYSDQNQEQISIIIPKHKNISFDEDIVVISVNNPAYIEGNNFEYLYGTQINSYINKPLLPGTIIEYKENELINSSTISYIVIKYYDGSENNIDFSKTNYYELYDLGTKSDSYLMRTKIQNDFYYTKIRTFKNNIFSTYSNQIIISPQIQADTNIPELINFSSIKIPVYQQKSIDISSYIYEDSGIRNINDIFIDFDLTIDSNNDGDNYNDKDFDLNTISNLFNIRILNEKIYFDLGPFDKLINKKIRINIVDTNNNMGYEDIDFVVYSPIPSIENIQNNYISGRINESLFDEPISFYRIRDGSIEKLKNTSNLDKTNTVDKGIFGFNLSQTSSGLSLIYSSGIMEPITLFDINEETGKIDISPTIKITQNLDIKVYSSNNLNNEFAYPKIIITKNNLPIYYQYIKTPNVGKVYVVNSFENINKIGIHYQHINNTQFDYFSMPLNIPVNDGDLFIYSKNDTSQTPIISIFKDGKIDINNEKYYLEYENFGDNVVLIIKDNSIEIPIGKIMIIPEKNYILK